MASKEDVEKAIAGKAEEIRTLKTAKATKEAIDAAVKELLGLKEDFKAVNGGIPFDPPKVEVKKEKSPQPEPVQREGPSKKELNKLARKEGRKGGKESDESEVAPVTAPATSAAVAGDLKVVAAAKVPPVATTLEPLTTGSLYYCTSSKLQTVPEISRLVAALLGSNIPCCVSPYTSQDHLPFFVASASIQLTGDCAIARYFTRVYANGSSLYNNVSDYDSLTSSQIDQWLDVYVTSDDSSAPQVLALLDAHLGDKTYVVGQSLTLADIAMYVISKRPSCFNAIKAMTNVVRWSTLICSLLPVIPSLKPSKKGSAGGSDKAKTTVGDKISSDAITDSGGGCPALEDAIEGQVCTRFPPEPSGYLHIGHAKAVLLNQYYAQRYKGKLLIRFDDTNPSKEKDEYEQNIIEDLKTLGVIGDKVSHTSDHFAKCEELARQMITAGLAYMDDTDQEKMQAERMERTESYRRNSSKEDNIAKFNSLLKGELEAQKYCLRAKIDMGSVNGTMRDPVLYRFNDTPHHRTGTRYKGYPTYDFACPIVDSIEGVTHALRTTEYNDRDEQYHWMQNALGLRKTKIQAFGKMNFVHTVLSKRKLNWFVENKLVEGWFDPRFPTIQGCVRRGMNVGALKSFIISQGASRRVVVMEWDKFWSENKKVLEENSHRYMGVSTQKHVTLHIDNVSSEITAHSVQIHPQKPEMGMRVMRRYNKLYIDQCDAVTIKEGEEITLLRWGNFVISRIEKDTDGCVTHMHATFDEEATNFSKTKKITWIAAIPDLVPCKLFEFDHLITKAKLDEDEKFENYVNENSKSESEALCDPCLRTLTVGQVIQLERKGFYRCDQIYGGSVDKPCVLFFIPDGKVVKQAAAMK